MGRPGPFITERRGLRVPGRLPVAVGGRLPPPCLAARPGTSPGSPLLVRGALIGRLVSPLSRSHQSERNLAATDVRVVRSRPSRLLLPLCLPRLRFTPTRRQIVRKLFALNVKYAVRLTGRLFSNVKRFTARNS